MYACSDMTLLFLLRMVVTIEGKDKQKNALHEHCIWILNLTLKLNEKIVKVHMVLWPNCI